MTIINWDSVAASSIQRRRCRHDSLNRTISEEVAIRAHRSLVPMCMLLSTQAASEQILRPCSMTKAEYSRKERRHLKRNFHLHPTPHSSGTSDLSKGARLPRRRSKLASQAQLCCEFVRRSNVQEQPRKQFSLSRSLCLGDLTFACSLALIAAAAKSGLCFWFLSQAVRSTTTFNPTGANTYQAESGGREGN